MEFGIPLLALVVAALFLARWIKVGSRRWFVPVLVVAALFGHIVITRRFFSTGDARRIERATSLV